MNPLTQAVLSQATKLLTRTTAAAPQALDSASELARNLTGRITQPAAETVKAAVGRFADQPIATGPLGRIDDAVWRFVVSHRPAGSPGPTSEGLSPAHAGSPAPWQATTFADGFFYTIHWVAQPSIVVTAGSLFALTQGILGLDPVRRRILATGTKPAWFWDVTMAQAMTSIGVVVTAQACSTGFKKLFGRQRPPEMFRLAIESARSFPSGHMIAAVAGCGALLALRYAGKRAAHASAMATTAPGVHEQNPASAADSRQDVASRTTQEQVPPALIAGCVAWCLIVGYDRLYMGVHWLSDLLGGAAIGGFWSFVAWKAQAQLRQHR
ncbi:phosphatase PAP2 family protein [Corynebacterium aquilae]|uniref:Phosphatidic acid phosphatase type 2/haloperoxidase domain-containing protein n=1 Tax=Corynebacterium aquilae DSM 44791 TaxID=1431546 RepID=A0A1L7CD86_9CORY|nr:phosphatase PAP2 family protein [Corynebacterium aquilae]APT83784.1 hypothetical protein CAQU_00295 [Corynebacterium aquilae DSM 44791]